MRGGDWVYVPRGTMVRNEATRESVERRTSYPLRLLRVEGNRAFWLGDKDRLYSAPVSALELIPGGYKRGATDRRAVQAVQRQAARARKRVVRCPHGFLPPLCPQCHGGECQR